MNIGGITIEMAADVARLRQDMEAAKGVVGGALGEMQRAADMAKAALGAVGVTLSLGALKSMITGAIDAAESLHDLSIQTGMTVERLSALQALGRTTGTSVDTIASVTNKLAKNMAVASEESKGTGQAIAALGLDFASFKSLKPDDQLVTLAKAMGQFEDGSGKSAVAMTLLGKEGAKLLPFMKDLAEANQLVATTTAEQAAQADQFNDALEESAMRTDAMKRAVALGLLPTLIDLQKLTQDLGFTIGQYLGGAAQSTGQKFDGMAVVILGVGTVLESLIVLSSDVAFVLNGIGREIGGLAAQAVAFMTGDFAGAGAIGDAMKADAAAARQELDEFQASVTGATAKILQARDALKNNSLSAAEYSNEMDRLTSAHGKTSKAVLDFNANGEKADKTLEQLKKRTDDYLKSIDEKLAVSSIELAQGEKLSEAQKAHMELTAKLADGTIKLTAAQEAAARSVIDWTEENRQAAEAVKAHAAAQAAVAQHSAKLNDAQIAETQTLRDGNVALQAELDGLTMTTQALRQREVQQLLAAAADKEWSAAMQGGNWQLEEQARLLRDRAGLIQQGAVVKEAQAAAEEWKRTTDSIQQGLTDALFRGLEAGQSMWVAFRDTLVNSFKNLVLQPTIKAVFAPIAGGIGSLFTGNALASGGGAGAGGGIGGLLSSFGNFFNGNSITNGATFGADAIGEWLMNNTSGGLNSLGGSLMGNAGAIGSGIGALGNGFAGYGISKMLSNGYSAGGSINTIAGIASAIPGVGPIAGVVGGLINRAFGMKSKEYTDQGISGSFGGGDFSGAGFANWKQDGGWFRSDRSGTDTTQLDSQLADALDAGASMLFEKTKLYAEALGLPAQNMADISQQIRITLGEDQAANQTAIAEALQSYQDALVAGIGTAIEPFLTGGETVIDAMTRMADALAVVNPVLESLGLTVYDVGVAGGDAASQLVALFGGLDNLAASAGRYYQNFYSESERAANTTEQLTATLAQFGLTLPETREAYRALVEMQDRNTESGRAAFAALLQLSDAFASLVPAAKEVADNLAGAGAALLEMADVSKSITFTRPPPSMPSGPLTTAQQARLDADPYWQGQMQRYGGALPGAMTGALQNFFAIEAKQKQATKNQGNAMGKNLFSGSGNGDAAAVYGWDSRTQALIDSMQAQIQATQDLIGGLADMSTSLRGLRDELVGGQFDPTSPEQKYLNAKAERESLARQALTGDMAAAAAYQAGTQDFLRMSQGYNASGAGYVADFNGVLATLETIATKLDSLNGNANATLKVQQAGLADITSNTAKTVQLQRSSTDAAKVSAQRNVE